MAQERRDLLMGLVQRSCPVSESLRKLSVFDFDSDLLFTVDKDDVIRVLSAYLEGSMSESEVEEWADAIEVRDDLGYSLDHGDAVKEVINDLANPLLSGPLTPAEAQRFKSFLQTA